MAETERSDGDRLQPYEPLPRNRFCSSIVKGQLYVWGGTTKDFKKREDEISSTVYRLDLKNTDQWSSFRTSGSYPPKLVGGATASDEHHLYVYGGGQVGGTYSGSLHRLHIGTSTWTQLSPHSLEGPREKRNCGMVTYSDQLIVFGGYCGYTSQPGDGCTNELHTFDLREGKWSSPTVTGTRPPPYDAFSFTKTDDQHAVLFGGYQPGCGYSNDVYIIDFKKMHWSILYHPKGQSWPMGRHSHAATLLNYDKDHQQLLITGGYSRGVTLSDVWMLDLQSGRWKEILLPEKHMKKRFGHCTAAFSLTPTLTEVVMFGGYDWSSNRYLSATTLLRFECSGVDWILKDCCDYSTDLGSMERVKMKTELMKRKSDLYTDENQGDVNDCIIEDDDDDNEEFIKGIEKAIAESGGKINRNLAHMMFVGPPGSGKSSLMNRLLGRPTKKFSASTGVCDSVVIVDIDMANPSTFHSATAIGTDTWEEIDCSSSFIRQLRQGNATDSGQETLPTSQMQTQSEEPNNKSDNLTESTASSRAELSSSSLSAVAKPLTVQPLGVELIDPYQPVSISLPVPRPIKENIQSLIKKYGCKDLNFLKKTSSLYLRDTGGQVEFQEMLALLICGPSIFIFVFRADLDFKSKFEVQYRKSVDESLNIYTSSITTEEALLQSLASVYAMDTSSEDITHQSLIFIIATHTDRLKSEREAKIAALNHHLDSLIKTNGFRHLVHYVDECKGQVVFEVDNTSENEDNFQLLRSRVNSLVSHYENFSIEYPISYLFFCFELQEIKMSILTLEECMVLAAKHGIIGEDKVLHLLRFLHIRIGLIRHFNVAGIRHIIVREPQVLFNKTTDLIVKTFSSHSWLPGQKTDFVKKGILRVSVLKSIVSSDDKISPEEFLLLLVHLRIAAPFRVAGDMEERYFIPCILNHVCSESTKEDKETDIASLCVKFKCNHCPKGIFGVLVTHLMRPEGDIDNITFALLEDKIYKDQVSFEVNIVDEIVLKLLPSHLKINFLPDSSDDRDSPIKEVCNNVRKVIRESILKSLKDLHYKREKVEPVMCFKCEQCSELHPVINGKEYQKIKCRKSNKTSRIPPNGRCWYNEDDDTGCGVKVGSVTPSQTSSVKGSSSSVGDGDTRNAGLTMLSQASNVERNFSNVAGPPCEHQQQHTCAGVSSGTLFRELLPLASEWQNIGVLLDIPDGDLEDIKKSNFNQQKDCLREMIKVWLKTSDLEPTWERLQEAVDLFDPKRAQEINSKYITGR